MLRLNNISKKLGDFALHGINVEISAGEYYVLLGRSGSGKTQLLELIAGLTDPDTGEIWIDNENVTNKRIQDRHVGLVFQDYAIFPNMTVFGNIAYPLHSKSTDKKTVNQSVNRIAEELNIVHILNRFTHYLSGGELQRVALARTLITSPKILLLDEPLASIDASLKDDIKKIFRKLNRKGLTIVHVTHDYREAVSLASKVGVIHNGHIIQEGKPTEVFTRPVNKFVARYAGIRNFFRVRFRNEPEGWKACCDGNLIFNMAEGSYPSDGLMIIRDDSIKIHSVKPEQKYDNCIKSVVRDIVPSEYGMEITVDAGELFYVKMTVSEFNELRIKEESEVWITFSAEAGIALQGTG